MTNKRANFKYPHNCHVCGDSFLSHRVDAKFCSPKCRKRASRERAEHVQISRDLAEMSVRYPALSLKDNPFGKS